MLQLFTTKRAGIGLGMSALLLGLAPAARAQSNTPKYSNEFMNLGAGARSLGMGKVQASLANDATAGYWNPAGLTNVANKYDGVLMHAELFSGIVKYDYAAFALPLDEKSTVGVTVLRSGVDNIADTRSLVNEYGYIDYSKITYFSVANYGLLLSYARKLGPEGLSVGANGKIIYQNVGNFANAYGFGVDVGVQYNHGGWRLGLVARDITTTYNAWSINADQFKANAVPGETIPTNSTEITLPRLVLGVGRQFTLPGQFTALVAADFEATTDGQRNTLLSAKPVSVDPPRGLRAGLSQAGFSARRAGQLPAHHQLRPAANLEGPVQPGGGRGHQRPAPRPGPLAPRPGCQRRLGHPNQLAHREPGLRAGQPRLGHRPAYFALTIALIAR